MEYPNETERKEEEAAKKPSTATKAIVLGVLVVLLVIGILLPIKLVPNAASTVASTLSSWFVPKGNVRLSPSPTELATGQEVTLTWSGAHRTDGSYAVTYSCTQGVRVETSISQPHETVPCDTPYYFTPNDNSITLSITSESNRFADIKFALSFLKNDSSQAQKLAESTVTVTNTAVADSRQLYGSATPTATVSVSPSPTPTAARPSPSPSRTPVAVVEEVPVGPADLTVYVIGAGYIDPSTSKFVLSESVAPEEQAAAIKFQVANVGGQASGKWKFVADLPSTSDPRFESTDQQSLYPGEKMEYVLSFENLARALDNYATIVVDPSNMLRERNEGNNTARVHIVNETGAGTYVGTGKADLSVRILETGIVDNGKFVRSNYSTIYDKVGIRFEVVNQGSRSTGDWKFHADLPSTDSSVASFTSETQSSLAPGEKAVFVIGYDQARQGTHSVTIAVDPNNAIDETTNSNNTATVSVTRN